MSSIKFVSTNRHVLRTVIRMMINNKINNNNYYNTTIVDNFMAELYFNDNNKNETSCLNFKIRLSFGMISAAGTK